MTNNPYESPIDSGSTQPKSRVRMTCATLVAVICLMGLLIALLLPATRNARPAARRSQCNNNLRQIGLALHGYHDRYGCFPPAYTTDAEGRPLHSWRTLILPFLVFTDSVSSDSIDFSKPWNDPANADAYNSCPGIYRCPSSDAPENHTTYLAIVGQNAFLHPTEARQFADITDGPNETLMVIDSPSEAAVHWMAPHDATPELVLGFDQETEFSHRTGTNALFGDGRIQFLPANTSVAVRRALISIAGNDSVVEMKE